MSDESKGGIVRVKKESRYFVASNQPFNDPRLSFGARGLMGYLLSKPDNWQIRNYDLYRKSPDGRSKVQGYLAELKKFGYLTRFPISKGKSGINWVSEVYESPEDNPHLSSYRFSNDENSNDEFSSFEKVPPITITKSPTTKPLNTDAQHGAAEFLGWIQEPSFSKITALDHLTPDLAAAWQKWYQKGDFPAWLKNPVGFAISQLEKGNFPPVEDSPAAGPVDDLTQELKDLGL